MRAGHVRSFFWSVAIGAALWTLGATCAWAQGSLGGLRGAVRDANGVVPGVQVALTNQGTNISRNTVTNDVGEYTFPAVTPGVYTVTAALQGFRTFERSGLTIATQQFITLDITLEVGGIREDVVVTGAAPLIETSDASLGKVLDAETIKALPSLTRNAFMLAQTAPTYSANVDPRQSRMQDQSGTSLVSLGGGLRGENNYVIDGVPITDMVNRPALLPTMEALEDIKVQVHTYDAEMGRTGGGVFNVTAKSGTNAFHGGGLYQNRPEWGMANSFFNVRTGIPKQPGLFFNAYAGSFGGPIVRNKTFFWVASEGYRDNSAWNGQLILPTDAERNGDFSQTVDQSGNLVLIYDPLTTRPDGNGGYIREPFPGNRIPADRINPVARNITNYLDHVQVQRSGADGRANFSGAATLSNQADSATVKVEHKFSDNSSLTGAYLYSHTNEPFQVFFQQHPELDPGWNIVRRRPKVLALNNTYVLSSTTVLTLRAGWMSFPSFGTPGSADFDMAGLGFPASFVNAVSAQKFPRINVLGFGQVGGSALIGDAGYSYTRDSSYNFNGTMSKLIGRHTVKFGGDFRDLHRRSAGLGQTAGTFQFDQGWTQSVPGAASRANNGNSFASFLLGLPTANTSLGSSVPINTPLDFFVRYYGGYVQDDWRISAKMTMNYGLRYEWEPGLREDEDRILVAFDRTVVMPLAADTGLNLHGGLRYAGQDGFPTSQGDPQKKKFSPRIGVAWSLDEQTVLRSGYGLFWAPFNYASYAALGYQQVTNLDQSNNLTPTVTLSNPFPNGLLPPVGNANGLLTGVGGPITFNNQDRRTEHLQQYSVELQRQLGNMAVSIGYIGTRGDDLNFGTININQLEPEVVAQWGARLNDQVANPFFGIAGAGAFSSARTISRGQLLRPFPQFGNVLQDQTTGGRSRYSGVTARLDKRGGWWTGSFHYTRSRLDTNQYNEGNLYYTTVRQTLPLNSYNLDGEYSRSLQDVPHRIVLSPIIRLPFGEGRKWATNGMADQIIGGWDLSVVATYESGFPVNVVQLTDNTGSFSGTQRPNWTGTSPATAGSAIDRLDTYVGAAAYSLAPAFTFGSGPRTDPRARTPFRTNYDVSISKNIPIFGGLNADIRAEMLNATNSPKFVGPETRLGTAQFGKITQQAGLMRITQLMLRIKW
jgi:trimeric autotransporter adhesin